MIPRGCPHPATILGFVLFLGFSILLFYAPFPAGAAQGEQPVARSVKASSSTQPEEASRPPVSADEEPTARGSNSLSASGPSSTALFGTASGDDTPLDFLAETATNSTFTQTLSFDVFSATLKMVTSLAIVIGLVMGLSWFLQQRGGLNRSIFGRTLGILPLDNRRFLYLVDIMGRVLVLGVTEHSINLLCEITDKASIDALRVQSKAPASASLERMFSFLRRGRSTESDELLEGAAQDPSMNFSTHTMNAQQQLQQIEKLRLKRQTAPDEGTGHQAFPEVTSPSAAEALFSRPAPNPPSDGDAQEGLRPSKPRDSSPPRPRNQL